MRNAEAAGDGYDCLNTSAYTPRIGGNVSEEATAVEARESERQRIEALLKRNNEQAEAFGFRGTPVFIVGTFRVPGGLTAEQFKQAIADARKAAKQGGAKGK